MCGHLVEHSILEGAGTVPVILYKSFLEASWAFTSLVTFWARTVGPWDHPERIPMVTVTFVEAMFVLATFVHIMNKPSVTDQIVTKL